jgi:hypothetical protein
MPKVAPRGNKCWKNGCEIIADQQIEGKYCCPDHHISEAGIEKSEHAKQIRHVKREIVHNEDVNEVNDVNPDVNGVNIELNQDVKKEYPERIVFVGGKRPGDFIERGDSAKYNRSDTGESPTKLYNNHVFRKVSNEKKTKSKRINRIKPAQDCISSEGEEEEQNVFSEYIKNSMTERKEEQVGEDAPGTSAKLIPIELSYKNEVVSEPSRVKVSSDKKHVSGSSRIKDEVKKVNVRIVTKSGKEAAEPKVQKVKMSEEDLSKKISKLSEIQEKALIESIMKKCNVSENLAKSHVRSLNPKK